MCPCIFLLSLLQYHCYDSLIYIHSLLTDSAIIIDSYYTITDGIIYISLLLPSPPPPICPPDRARIADLIEEVRVKEIKFRGARQMQSVLRGTYGKNREVM